MSDAWKRLAGGLRLRAERLVLVCTRQVQVPAGLLQAGVQVHLDPRQADVQQAVRVFDAARARLLRDQLPLHAHPDYVVAVRCCAQFDQATVSGMLKQASHSSLDFVAPVGREGSVDLSVVVMRTGVLLDPRLLAEHDQALRETLESQFRWSRWTP